MAMVKLKEGLYFWFDGQDLLVRKSLHSTKVFAFWSSDQEQYVVNEHGVNEKRNISMPFKDGFRNGVHSGHHIYVGSADLFPL